MYSYSYKLHRPASDKTLICRVFAHFTRPRTLWVLSKAKVTPQLCFPLNFHCRSHNLQPRNKNKGPAYVIAEGIVEKPHTTYVVQVPYVLRIYEFFCCPCRVSCTGRSVWSANTSFVFHRVVKLAPTLVSQRPITRETAGSIRLLINTTENETNHKSAHSYPDPPRKNITTVETHCCKPCRTIITWILLRAPTKLTWSI